MCLCDVRLMIHGTAACCCCYCCRRWCGRSDDRLSVGDLDVLSADKTGTNRCKPLNQQDPFLRSKTHSRAARASSSGS